MASKIKLGKGKEFNFPAEKSGGGQASKYPWDEWFSGDLLLLERSDGIESDKGTITTPTTKRDYEVATNGMPPKIKTAARHRYKVVQVSRRDADGGNLVNSLIIKARDMTDDERASEDLLRAEEKAEMKARKDADKVASNSQPDYAPTI